MGLIGLGTATAGIQQGGSFGGSGGGGMAGQAAFGQSPGQAYLGDIRALMCDIRAISSKPKTFREELQAETDEWLSDIK